MIRVTGRSRLVRGLIAGSLTTFLAAVSHLVGGGQISVLAAVVSLVLTLPLSVGLAGRLLTPARVAAVVLVGQGLYHSLFSILGSTTTAPPPGAAYSQAAGHPAAHGPDAAPLLGGAHLAHDHSAVMGPAHLLAALGAIAVVLHGEKAWWQVVQALALTLRRLGLRVVVLLCLPVKRERALSSFEPVLASASFVLRCPDRRGPPLRALLAGPAVGPRGA